MSKPKPFVVEEDDDLMGPPIEYGIKTNPDGTQRLVSLANIFVKEKPVAAVFGTKDNIAIIEAELAKAQKAYLDYAKSINANLDIDQAIADIKRRVTENKGVKIGEDRGLHLVEVQLLAMSLEIENAAILVQKYEETRVLRELGAKKGESKDGGASFLTKEPERVELKSYKIVEYKDEETDVTTKHLAATYVKSRNGESKEFDVYFSIGRQEAVRRGIVKHDLVIVSDYTLNPDVQDVKTLYTELHSRSVELYGRSDDPNIVTTKAEEIIGRINSIPRPTQKELDYLVIYFAYNNARDLNIAEQRVDPRSLVGDVVAAGNTTPAPRPSFYIVPSSFTKIIFSIAEEKIGDGQILRNLCVEYAPDSARSSFASMDSEDLRNEYIGYRAAVPYNSRYAKKAEFQTSDVDHAKKQVNDTYKKLTKSSEEQCTAENLDKKAAELETKVKVSSSLNNDEAEFLNAYLKHQNAVILQKIEAKQHPKTATAVEDVIHFGTVDVKDLKRE